MSEQTYTRIVVTVVLILFLLGLIYAEPFATARAQTQAKRDERHFPDCATLAGIARARCERHERMFDKFTRYAARRTSRATAGSSSPIRSSVQSSVVTT